MIIIIIVVVKITQSTWFPHLIQKKWKDQEKIEHHKTLRDQVIIYHLRGRGSCKDHAEEGESLDYRGGEGGGEIRKILMCHMYNQDRPMKNLIIYLIFPKNPSDELFPKITQKNHIALLSSKI